MRDRLIMSSILFDPESTPCYIPMFAGIFTLRLIAAEFIACFRLQTHDAFIVEQDIVALNLTVNDPKLALKAG